jgi:hypothetical protein
VARLPGHTSYVMSLAFSPDGATLVSGSGDSTVRLWDTEPLKKRYRARREAETLRPDAERLVAATPRKEGRRRSRSGNSGGPHAQRGPAARGLTRRAATFSAVAVLMKRRCG